MTESRPIDRQLILIMLLATFVRFAAILAFPSVSHPDEIFQAYEPAHRLVFGYGITTWEYEIGMRSFVLPYLLTFPFRLTSTISTNPYWYLLVSQALLMALSLLPVIAVYRMGLRISPAHALTAGIAVAAWFELVYFSYRPLTEAIACDFLLLALALGSFQSKPSRARLIAIGFCVASCLMFRVHLALGLIVFTLWVCKLDFRERWAPVMIGAASPLIVFGVSDWITRGGPFASFINAFRENVINDKASGFGAEGVYWYPEQLFELWGAASLIIIILLIARIRKYFLWVSVALAIIISHSFIPHKEYRFIYPASACLVVAAALGSADVLEKLSKMMKERWRPFLTYSGGVFWLLLSMWLAFAPGFVDRWFWSRDALQAMLWLSRRSDVCGLSLYDNSWGWSGGYTYLHRNIPIYDDPEMAPSTTSLFNYIFLKRSSMTDFREEFPHVKCFGAGGSDDTCLAWRDGVCERDQAQPPLLEQTGLGAPAPPETDPDAAEPAE